MKRDRAFDLALTEISDDYDDHIHEKITPDSLFKAGGSMMSWMFLNISLSFLNKFLFQEKVVKVIWRL